MLPDDDLWNYKFRRVSMLSADYGCAVTRYTKRRTPVWMRWAIVLLLVATLAMLGIK